MKMMAMTMMMMMGWMSHLQHNYNYEVLELLIVGWGDELEIYISNISNDASLIYEILVIHVEEVNEMGFRPY